MEMEMRRGGLEGDLCIWSMEERMMDVGCRMDQGKREKGTSFDV